MTPSRSRRCIPINPNRSTRGKFGFLTVHVSDITLIMTDLDPLLFRHRVSVPTDILTVGNLGTLRVRRSDMYDKENILLGENFPSIIKNPLIHLIIFRNLSPVKSYFF